jgi:putative glycerol-1-phosphate prenyltransferase
MKSGNSIYQQLITRKQKGVKSFALLIDPDKTTSESLNRLMQLTENATVDFILVGGSLMVTSHLDACIQQIKASCSIPVILFPGSPSQISRYADALLYLSLISGRNPELLIGQHVISAPALKSSGLEILSTGYMLIDGGVPTTVSYISSSTPIPADKPDIAMCTAMAGEMLGLKMIYMDAGSGARNPISTEMVQMVSKEVQVPLWVGGGITQPEQAYRHCKNGADVIVVGNAIEKSPELLIEMAAAIHSVPEKI